jgi:hypothetical protein
MISRREFTERYGDPANFAFRGQAYPSSTPAKCAVCGHDIRNVYSLCPPQGRSVPSGECCFGIFKTSNPRVYALLQAARLLLTAYEDGEKNDIKTYSTSGDVKYRTSEWRKLRRKVLEAIREYRKLTGSDWLPKPLYDALEEANRCPGKTCRWFDAHIPALREKLQNLSI